MRWVEVEDGVAWWRWKNVGVAVKSRRWVKECGCRVAVAVGGDTVICVIRSVGLVARERDNGQSVYVIGRGGRKEEKKSSEDAEGEICLWLAVLVSALGAAGVGGRLWD